MLQSVESPRIRCDLMTEQQQNTHIYFLINITKFLPKLIRINGVIIHLEPDILECEIKWALESITTNKASAGDGIPVKLIQILKYDAVKCCTQYTSKFGKFSSGHRMGKGQFSFQFQRKAMPKNVQTTSQLHSSHMLVK